MEDIIANIFGAIVLIVGGLLSVFVIYLVFIGIPFAMFFAAKQKKDAALPNQKL